MLYMLRTQKMLVVILSPYLGVEQWVLQTRCLLNVGLSVTYSEVWNVVFFSLTNYK